METKHACKLRSKCKHKYCNYLVTIIMCERMMDVKIATKFTLLLGIIFIVLKILICLDVAPHNCITIFLNILKFWGGGVVDGYHKIYSFFMKSWYTNMLNIFKNITKYHKRRKSWKCGYFVNQATWLECCMSLAYPKFFGEKCFISMMADYKIEPLWIADIAYAPMA